VIGVLPPKNFMPDEHWNAGSDVAICCRRSKCERQARWLASQHGCVSINLCDEHMLDCFRDVSGYIKQLGLVRCPLCDGNFRQFEAFITAVKM